MIATKKIKIYRLPVERESRSPVGSSKSKISGSFARALAIATLYCSPPESSEGK